MAPSRFVFVALAVLLCAGWATAAAPKKRQAKCGEHLQYINYKNKAENDFMRKVIYDCLKRKLPLPAGFPLPYKKAAGWWKPTPRPMARAGDDDDDDCESGFEEYCCPVSGFCSCVPEAED